MKPLPNSVPIWKAIAAFSVFSRGYLVWTRSYRVPTAFLLSRARAFLTTHTARRRSRYLSRDGLLQLRNPSPGSLSTSTIMAIVRVFKIQTVEPSDEFHCHPENSGKDFHVSKYLLMPVMDVT